MGSMQAADMSAAVGEGEVSMRMALNWHLTANHWPPVHTIFVDCAMEAIRLVADEEYDTMVKLPGTQREERSSDIVEQLHLWEFVNNADAVPE
jgi:hypothetical protein